jgi:hypothetical protein
MRFKPRPRTPAKAKTDRAEEHLEEIDAQLRIFFNRKPYELFSEIEAETGDKVYRVRMRENIPQHISLVAGDVIHNARSALDLMYCALVGANGKTVAESDAFPVSKSAQQFNARSAEIRRRIGQDAANVLQVIEPYKGGDGEAIWRLHRLDIVDKHRLLLATGMCIPVVRGPFYLFGRSGEVIAAQRFPEPWWEDTIKDGAEISRIKPHPDFEGRDQPNVTFDVALSEPEIAKVEPLIETLTALLQEANRVIDSLAPFV